jgi:hypothetical protein
MTTRKTLLATLAILSLGVFAPALAQAAGFEVSNFAATANNADGSLDTQAGDHPFSATTSFDLSGADVKDNFTELPPGFTGNPLATARCPLGQLRDFSNPCPSDTQIGIALVNTIFTVGEPVPVFNMVPEAGHPAEFGLLLGASLQQAPALLYPSLRAAGANGHSGDYGVNVRATGIVQGSEVTHVTVTLWGVPADPRHDSDRGSCLAGGGLYPNGGPCSIGAQLKPFLSDPAQCVLSEGQPNRPTTSLVADSWQNPAVNPDGTSALRTDASPDRANPNWLQQETQAPAVTGCDRLAFNPTFAFTPDAGAVDSPTGASVDLHVPQSEGANQLATPQLKDAEVTLPAGLSVSPSSADGLQACSNEQVALESGLPASCPEASQIATVEVHTPLLDHPLPGVVYLGAPECGPCSNADASSGRLLRLFIAVNDPQTGIVVKLPGSVTADPSSGQLTAAFRQNPQLPFEDLDLHFKSGPRAPLATPPTCGSFTTTTDLTPWSNGGPDGTPDATPSSTFNVSFDGAGAACPATLPFAPSFSAGTTDVLANDFSPLSLSFARSDGQQTLSQLSTQLPPGLLGMISSVAQCAEPQASQGTCGASSLIGHVTVGAGPGPQPFYVHGSVYLTGPYKGAPFGLSVVVPAVAGPFNLGNVIVRAAIAVDPHDAHVTVISDPFPQILAGVPLRVKSVSVSIDRPGFVFNPTSCAQQSITATIAAAQGAAANVSNPFQAGGCRGLPFSPRLTASLAGRSSKKNGAALKVKIVEGVAGEANVHSVKVQLPTQLPSRLTTLQKACTAAVFDSNPASCPAASIVGTARATTPVLAVPLSGPAILVSHGGQAFPDLDVVLQGEGVTVDLVGNTQIKKGITTSTFATVPDAPVATFELNLPTGPFSILGTNLPANKAYDFCASKLTMPTTIVAQNGAELEPTTKIAITGCPPVPARGKANAAKKKAKAAKHKHGGKKASATRSATVNRRAK